MVIVSLISIIVQTHNLHCNHKESIWVFFLSKKLYGSLYIFSVFHKSSNLNFVILKKVLYHFIVAVIKLRVLVLFFFHWTRCLMNILFLFQRWVLLPVLVAQAPWEVSGVQEVEREQGGDRKLFLVYGHPSRIYLNWLW